MPGGDRTGPWGGGPRTGRGAGYCAGFGQPGYASPSFFGRGGGFGRGAGRGGGRGWRHRYYATSLPGWAGRAAYAGEQADAYFSPDVPSPAFNRGADELSSLKQQARSLGQALKDINRRIEEIEKNQHRKEGDL